MRIYNVFLKVIVLYLLLFLIIMVAMLLNGNNISIYSSVENHFNECISSILSYFIVIIICLAILLFIKMRSTLGAIYQSILVIVSVVVQLYLFSLITGNTSLVSPDYVFVGTVNYPIFNIIGIPSYSYFFDNDIQMILNFTKGFVGVSSLILIAVMLILCIFEAKKMHYMNQ